jgi:hypothetical protein
VIVEEGMDRNMEQYFVQASPIKHFAAFCALRTGPNRRPEAAESPPEFRAPEVLLARESMCLPMAL